jgi:hypothetical protein
MGAASERTFSCIAPRQNCYLRNRMGNERFSGLSMLSVEKDIAKNLNTREIVAKFDGSRQNSCGLSCIEGKNTCILIWKDVFKR